MKGRIRVTHTEFPTIYGDWEEFESNLEDLRNALGEACLGEKCLVVSVNGELKFFGKDLLKQCIVTLEIEEDGNK